MDRWLIDSTPGPRFPAFTRGNAADVFPDPASPFMVTFYLRPSLDCGVRDAYIEMGVFDWDELENPSAITLFGVFGGYVYNPLSMTRLFGARLPGASPEAIDKAFFDERSDVPPYEAMPWHESERHAQKLADTMAWALSTQGLPELDRDKAIAEHLRAERPDFTTLDIPALLARARSMVPYLRQMFDTGMIVSTLSSIGPGALGAICEGLGDATLSIRLLAGIEADSAEPPKAMWELSRQARASTDVTALFAAGVNGLDRRLRASASPDAVAWVAAFDEFLFHYGSRGPNEWDVLAKTWEVRPDSALGAIDRMRMTDDAQSPSLRGTASVAERDRILVEVRAKLASDTDTAGLFESALRSAQIFLSGRERYKTNCIKVVGEIRTCMREVGRRLVEQGLLAEIDEVFMVLAGELDEFQVQPERFTAVLAQRAAEHRSLFDLEPPFAVDRVCPPISAWKHRSTAAVEQAASGAVLKGSAGSGGVATGRARVILDPSDPSDLDPGDILIAPQTDPSWGPLFVPAAGVIVNVGAMGSHAMIVCRELGIPCVVSVENATGRIPDGATVTVDGNAGTVTVH